MFVAWLAVIFLLGGSSRGDMPSLLVLRPLSLLVLGGLVITMTQAQLDRWRVLLGLMAAAIMLSVIHLIPLPPALWQAMPGRDVIKAVDEAAGLQGLWRPLSISPEHTRNALFALAVPASVLLWMTRFDLRQRLKVVLVAILGIALASALLGLLQISAGSENSPLYYYRVNNAGSPIGLFANRNHQAVFLACMLPMLAAYASIRGQGGDETARFRLSIAAGGAAFIVLFLLLLGSRAGIVTGLLGLASMPFVGRFKLPARIGKASKLAIPLAGAAAVAGLTALAVVNSRSEALDRLLGSDNSQDIRFTSMPYVGQLAVDYLPFGSGIGTFVQAWYEAEPDAMLEPRYLNHAHNDLLEIVLTGGIPAMLLVLAAVGLAALAGWRAFRTDALSNERVPMARASFVAIFLLLLASIVDYPLRTPALMALAAIAAVCLGTMLFRRPA